MYGDYVSWLADGKSAKVMKAHELVDADCRCAALPRPAPPRPAPRRPCLPVPRRPVPVARLGAARSSHLPRGNDETTKMMLRRVRTSRAEEIHLHVSLLPSARRQLATHTTPRAPGLGRASCPPATPADSTRRRGKSVDRRLARAPACRRKMRLLTLVSLAKGSKELSYASVAAGLQVEASGARPAHYPDSPARPPRPAAPLPPSAPPRPPPRRSSPGAQRWSPANPNPNPNPNPYANQRWSRG